MAYLVGRHPDFGPTGSRSGSRSGSRLFGLLDTVQGKSNLVVTQNELFEAAGGGAAVFVGTTPIVLSQTGSLLSSTALSGSTTATFGQTGALNSRAAFVGSSTVTFGQSGTLRGNAAFSGTATITFNQSGDFVAGAPLGNADFVGTASITFAQTGNLSAGASLNGTATATFAQSGSLRANSGLSGASTIAFGQSGSLRSYASLNGSTAVVFGQSGDFIAGLGGGDAVFVGSTTITFGQSGTFTSTGGVSSSRGDDGGYIRETGSAKAAIYKKQLQDFIDLSNLTAKQETAKPKVKKLRKQLAELQEAIPFYPVQDDFAAIGEALTQFGQNKIDDTIFLQIIIARIAEIQSYQDARKRRNRNIAIAMLMAA